MGGSGPHARTERTPPSSREPRRPARGRAAVRVGVRVLGIAALLGGLARAHAGDAPGGGGALVVELWRVPPDDGTRVEPDVYVETLAPPPFDPPRPIPGLGDRVVRTPLRLAPGGARVLLAALPPADPADRVELVVDVPGARLVRRRLELPRTEERWVESSHDHVERVRLDPATTVHGRLRVPDARSVGVFVEPEVGPARFVALAILAPDGVFSARLPDDAVPKGPFRVVVAATTADGVTRVARVHGTRHAILEVREPVPEAYDGVTGRCPVEAGAPVASWLGAPPSGRADRAVPAPRTATTVADAPTWFGLGGLDVGPWRLRATVPAPAGPVHPDLADAFDVVIRVPAGNVDLGAPPRRIDLTTRDLAGAPLSTWASVDGPSARLWVRTDATGRASAWVRGDREHVVTLDGSLEPAPVPAWRAVARTAGGFTWRESLHGRRDDDVWLRAEGPMARDPWPRAFAATLRVRGPDGLPLAARVRLVGPDGTARPVTVYAFGPTPTTWVAEAVGRAPLADEVRVAARGGPPAPGSVLEIGGDGLSTVLLPLPSAGPLDATVSLVVVATPASSR
ncbi:MAG: hypothetical protein U1E39_10120 [Planctomycetota bacterium]